MQFMASRTQESVGGGFECNMRARGRKKVCKNSCLLTELRFNIQSYSALSTSKNASTYYYFICTEGKLNSGMPVSELRTISPQDFLIQVLLVSHTQFKQEKKKNQNLSFFSPNTSVQESPQREKQDV